MRTIAALTLILLTFSGTVAQAEAETPRQSFEAFVSAVLDQKLTKEERRAQLERYFAFDEWLKQRGGEPTEDERATMKEDWFKLLESADFRDSYRKREVKVLEEPKPDLAAGTAELVIGMKGEAGTERFRVLMQLSADGRYWRWYSIPQLVTPPEPTTPAERMKAIEDSLIKIERERAHLDQLEDALRRELAKLRANEAESGPSTPTSVVSAAWAAIEKGDVDALLDCHLASRVAAVKLEEARASVEKTRQRLMSWQVMRATISADDPARAIVPVRLKLRRTGEPDERTISVRVVKVGESWKIDEAP